VIDLKRAVSSLEKDRTLTLASVPDGFDAFCIADLTRALARAAERRSVVLVHVARDEQRARAFNEAMSFAAPEIEVMDFPAWDCQPYDRVSPNAAVTAARTTVLSRLALSRTSLERPRILSTSINAVLQRVPPRQQVAQESFSAAPGNAVDMETLVQWLEANGFARASTVRDTGDYAVRGGILDLFPPGMTQPVRLDFFGDTLESIRTFDPETQRTSGQMKSLDLVPMSEVQIKTDTMRRFRQAYVARFGAQTRGDALYEAISEGRRHAGFEHWLPLFYDKLDTLFDYVGDAPFVLDPLTEDAAQERLTQIKDYYDARKSAHDADPAHSSFKPLEPDALYLSPSEWRKDLDTAPIVRVTPFSVPGSSKGLVIDGGARPGRSFAPERQDENANVFQAAADHARALLDAGKRVIVAGWSDGSRERLAHVLGDHGLKNLEPISSLVQAQGLKKGIVALAVVGRGPRFDTEDISGNR
jgi:transcription-repair coupling factor (superfamily II helicase)